ncbi:MAG TPA: sigma 54-interacting transcriptional regulator [Rectinemataceae bacterium]|nr:sigma 54-interacting transcriptional regulator [Rectinemataceae bacterium]
MKAIAYWDMDSLRIRKVLNELQAGFEVRLTATLGELRKISVIDRDVHALVIGLPTADRESIMSLLGTFSGISGIPIFVLVGERTPVALDPGGAFICVYSEELPSLFIKIVAATEKAIESAEGPVRIFIGRSDAIQGIAALVKKYALSRHPVLILGETGTGKELVAEAIHRYSPRKEEPFIALNCSALPENLVESELFGAEKGAFTDAVKHRGALAKAARGTLFLDEIGSMLRSVQPKLLRALETGEYWKLGAESPEKSDFRLVSATCSDIDTQIKRGYFREDLFYRISDLPIRIPPLREHIEDVVDLAQHFCLQAGKGYCEISAPALGKLMDYRWPGNVRELKSVINRACVNVQKGAIQPDDIVFMSGLKEAAKRGRRS